VRIAVTADYRGVLTGERFYIAGEYVVGDAMPLSHATALLDANRATLIEADTEPEPAPVVRVTKRRGNTGHL